MPVLMDKHACSCAAAIPAAKGQAEGGLVPKELFGTALSPCRRARGLTCPPAEATAFLEMTGG